MGEKLLFRWSRDQCSAKREKWLHTSVGLGFWKAPLKHFHGVSQFINIQVLSQDDRALSSNISEYWILDVCTTHPNTVSNMATSPVD